jgi:uncharacterized membrane protein YgdD (TMEM256/DUF423 family)
MKKNFLALGAILGLIGVALGAFGAHALKDYLSINGNLNTFETAVKYQFYHALALLFTAILSKEFANKWNNYAGKAFFIGTLMFSGSLYLICFTNIKMFGAIAPIGGTFLILGWASLLLSFLKSGR